ncbi:MAG: ABC transporter permease [Bacteroides sp.]|nr:ABC transporter permease [Bacteroides sp.]
MMRQIWIQIRNGWKSNLWLMGGLFLIAATLWYAVDFVYATAVNQKKSLGFEWENVYYLQLGCLTPESPSFVTDNDHTIRGSADFETILERVGNHPAVEYVGVSDFCIPYIGGSRGGTVICDSVAVASHHRLVTPGYFDVFGIRGASGESSRELSGKLQWGKVILTSRLAEELFGGQTAVGKLVENQYQPSCKEVAAVCENQKFNEYGGYRNYVYIPLRYDGLSAWEVAEHAIFIRTKPRDDETDFIQHFRREMATQLKVGNLYLQNMRSLADMRKDGLSDHRSNLYTQLSILVFVLLNIFIALLGTFWIRVQQRRAEIGVRITFGSTRHRICRMLIGEGIFLLTLGYLPALIVGLNLGVAEVVSCFPVPFGPVRFAGVSLITYAILVLITVSAILFPARQAMRLQPAEVLHEE